jgi:hypothetical protein
MKFNPSRLHALAAVALVAAALCRPGLATAAADIDAAPGTSGVQPAAACTGWSSNSTPPPTVKVLRTATGVVQTVDLMAYTKVVMAAEFNKTWPIETLRAGAIAIKEYAWYYTIHYRGGTKNGACYDVQDNSNDQIYSPESRTPSASEIKAVETTWNQSILRSGVIFLTGYRPGSSTTCGADKDNYHLMQLSARGCGLLGHSAEYILQLYYVSITFQGGPVPPDAPTGVSAVAFDTSAQVSWSAPLVDGGREVNGYTVTSNPDGKTCSTTGALTCAVSGLTNLTPYTFTVTASNRAGTGPASDPSAAVTPAVLPGSTYTSITPVRLLDTRSGNGSSGKIAANTPRTFQVAGRDVIPAAATAVTGNLTVTGQSNGWAVYLGPDPISAPSSSTINFAGGTTANAVTVALGGTGTLSATYISSGGNSTHLVFDVTGFFMADVSGETFHPLAPARIVDSRTPLGLAHKLSANTPATFPVWLHGGVPDNATAVTGNLTAVNSTSSWAVYLGPQPIAKPSTSTVNFARGQVRANNVTVALSDTGTLSATFMANSGNTMDLVFDVTGYYTDDLSGGVYVPIVPVRLLDSRSGNGLAGALPANLARTFQVTGRACIPPTATAVSGIVTVTNQTDSWAVFIGPEPEASPTVSTLNFVKGEVRANGLTVQVGPTGSLSATYISTAANSTHLVFDATGYFQPATP